MNIQLVPQAKALGWAFIAFLTLAMTAADLQAQRGRGRGGDRGGGDRGGGDRGGGPGGGFGGGPGMMRGDSGGGPGAMRGGFGGGPGAMRGGFGGGPGGGPGGMPGGGPSSFLSRLDRNGNGMLDPDEIDGRMRGMVERMAGDAKIDMSRPIPLATITRGFERMREQRSDDSSRNDSRGGDRSRTEPEVEPLVPGFGEVDLFDPVPGFGDLGEKFAVKSTDEDRQEATRTMSRNDTNKDGVLDAEEIRRGRWSTDALQTDRNGDGKLTLNELALRYAVRRAEREGSSTSNSSRTTSRSSSSRGSSDSRGSSSDGQNRMIEMMFGRYDRNSNGVIDRGDEMDAIRGGGDRYDQNKDGKITRDEFTSAIAGRFGQRGGEGDRGSRFYSGGGDSRGGNSRGGDSRDGGSDDGGGTGRKSYRGLSPSERLANFEGLPEWFARSDLDQDGQVKMSEYASSWSDAVVADFSQFDLNGDGIVTPIECLNAKELGAVQGTASLSTASTSSRYGSRSSSYGSSPSSRSESPREESPREESPDVVESTAAVVPAAGAPANVDPKYVKYAVGIIAKYDANKDGVLVEDEWKSAGKDYSTADADQDGRLTPVELAADFTKKR